MRIEINGRVIAPGRRTYVIAELSANHNQDLDRAVAIVEAAHEAGADAVKLQTYTADTLTLDLATPEFLAKGTIWEGRTLHDLYQEAMTPWSWQPKLKDVANGLGLDLFSTPFDDSAVEFLESLDVPAYKIASFELVDIPLLRRVAALGKPVIMSTGMATLAEIEEAVRTVRQAGCTELALLKCTSAYPAPIEEANLRTIADLSERFQVPVGLSDHTLGPEVPALAVAAGACIVEKHLTLSRDDPGPDSAFSLEPHEFRETVERIRQAEHALGQATYGATPKQEASLRFRRSLFVSADMTAGDVFSEANVRSVRPAAGLHTRHLEEVLGKRASRDIAKGTPLAWDLVADATDG